MRNSATKISAIILGLYAGALGSLHGVFEILQGNAVAEGITIQAIGAGCQADQIWHACLPAMTIIPQIKLSGILALIFSLLLLFWSLLWIRQARAWMMMSALLLIMLLTGAGFVPVYTGLMGMFAAVVMHTERSFFPQFPRLSAVISRLRPWILAAFFIWALGSWPAGAMFNGFMLRFSLWIFLICDIGLPFLVLISGMARDDANHVQS